MTHPQKVVTPVTYSIIVPVYNRPDEVADLMESLRQIPRQDLELIIVEDGSSVRCDHVIERYKLSFPVKYFFKQNEGPGPARNFGFSHATGNFLVVFDSDCVLPPHYFDAVDAGIRRDSLDAWGGPDRAHENFTILQQAMGYTMSSVLTTGGIRGAKRRIGWFQPRSFNMGISRDVFTRTGGFRFDRFAEDIELSIRMKASGFRVGLIPDAFVYHKRRTSFGGFFRQVFNFGRGRVLVGRAHSGEVKLAHWFPTAFTLLLAAVLLSGLVNPRLMVALAALPALYLTMIFLHALVTTRRPVVAILAVPSALVQLTGYGLGFISEWLKRPRA